MNRKKTRITFWIISGLLFISVSLFLLFGLPKEHRYEGFFFDSYVSVKFYECSPFKARKIISLIEKEFMRIDSIPVNGLTHENIDSTAAGIIKKSLIYSRKTDGYFDPSIDVILKTWNYFKEPILPVKDRIDSLLDFINYRKIRIKNDSILIPDGFSLTIGGCAKGYALDRITELMKNAGISSAIIEAGGDISLIGKKRWDSVWRIGIRHPRDKSSLIGTIKASDCFIATSGDYERYFLIDGVRYHHIINPYSGFPQREIQSITIIGKSGFQVDCLTTALLAMGKRKALEFIDCHSLEALMVDSSGGIHNFINMKNFEEEI